MGLSAFNRMRERQAVERAKDDKAERMRIKAEQEANEKAVNEFVALFPLDLESPDFVKAVLYARIMYCSLTPAQRDLADEYVLSDNDESCEETCEEPITLIESLEGAEILAFQSFLAPSDNDETGDDSGEESGGSEHQSGEETEIETKRGRKPKTETSTEG